jgi:hypothetical protein
MMLIRNDLQGDKEMGVRRGDDGRREGSGCGGEAATAGAKQRK